MRRSLLSGSNVLRTSLALIVLFLLVSCGKGREGKSGREAQKKSLRDWKEIKEEGVLRAITNYSGTSYFLYKGKPMGFEYELLERLADYLDVRLEIVLAENIDSIIPMLERGEGDIIAFGLTITEERKKRIDFTDYLYLTRQVLVQRKPPNWRRLKRHQIDASLIQDPVELINDTVALRLTTSYYERLKNLQSEIGGVIYIDTMAGDLSAEKLIQSVVDGDIKYTIVDDNIAAINAAYHPILDVSTPVSFSQRIAWGIRPSSPNLRDTLNGWIAQARKDVDYRVIYNKYFKNKRAFRARVKSEFYSLNEQRISPYDDLIKENAERIGWDWRLLAAQVYQESQFDPEATSWAGAAGLLQLMKGTASDLNVENRLDPEENLRGGVDYLGQIYDNFDEVPDSLQRVKLALASFNCGYYHVLDAQRLAKKRGLDPKTWDENVAAMILELSFPRNYNDEVVKYGYVKGVEPFTYVEEIMERYEHYKMFVE